MNRRAVAIGSGLLVTVTGTALVGSASAAAERSTRRTPRSSVERSAPVELPSVDPAMAARIRAVQVRTWTDAVNAQRWYAEVSANIERERAAAAAAAAVSARRPSTGSSGSVLDCIRHRESRGQYGVVNTSSGAAGAYQFMPRTWDSTARSAGRHDLVGVNPSNASATDQDAMARHLMATQGLGPWGGACA